MADLQSANERLMLLRPKTYTYRTEEYPQLSLPEGLRYGFIAQEVGEHFPQWVRPVHHPQELDSLGNVVSPSVDFMGLSTSEMIPLLVAAAQEQQLAQSDRAAEIAALRERLDQLEALLAVCCNNPDGARMLDQGSTRPTELEGSGPDSEKLHIQPNPFIGRTTVYYRVEQAGRAQLLANSADGKELRGLYEATLEPGSYQHEWDTADLAPGMYYVTLLLNGQPVVKKAVKVNR